LQKEPAFYARFKDPDPAAHAAVVKEWGDLIAAANPPQNIVSMDDVNNQARQRLESMRATTLRTLTALGDLDETQQAEILAHTPVSREEHDRAVRYVEGLKHDQTFRERYFVKQEYAAKTEWARAVMWANRPVVGT
jgi:hypothetical protein